MTQEWVNWLFEGVAAAAALMILFSRSVFNAGLHLFVAVLSIGVLFGLYGSEFLFFAQIMVYGGGILVLILFATMVTAKKGSLNMEISHSYSIPGLLIALGVIVIVTVFVMAYQPQGIPYVVNTATLGQKLILDYSLPLEVAGILLLVSLIGAAISAIQKPHEQ
jgi:NADH-quinone oxidoreductase subunit J